jgi:hypothetical protein
VETEAVGNARETVTPKGVPCADRFSPPPPCPQFSPPPPAAGATIGSLAKSSSKRATPSASSTSLASTRSRRSRAPTTSNATSTRPGPSSRKGRTSSTRSLPPRSSPVIEEGTDELDALTPPEELEDDYDRWISLTREGVASLDELEAAAAAGDAEGLQEIVESLDDSEAEADSLAQEIGFQECGGED